MPAATDPTAPALGGQLATFRLNGDLYGIEVAPVQEVLRGQSVTASRSRPPPSPA